MPNYIRVSDNRNIILYYDRLDDNTYIIRQVDYYTPNNTLIRISGKQCLGEFFLARGGDKDVKNAISQPIKPINFLC